MLDELNPPAIYGEAVAGRSAKVRESLLRLSANINASVADMVELLTEAVENNYLPAWGFSSVLEYGTEELGLKKRKTQYLTRIGKVTKAVGLTRSQWEPAGTSKLREICTLDPEGSYWNIAEHANEDMAEHIVRLILDCDKLTVKQVKEEVLRLKGRVGPDRPVVRSTSYPQSVWENVIKPARELARRLLGSSGRDDEGNAKEYSDGVCDEMIYSRFLTDPNNSPEPQELPKEEKDMQDYVNAELPME